jgi:hypothetical protein
MDEWLNAEVKQPSGVAGIFPNEALGRGMRCPGSRMHAKTQPGCSFGRGYIGALGVCLFGAFHIWKG